LLSGASTAAYAQAVSPIDRERIDRQQPAAPVAAEAPAIPGAATRIEAADEAATPIRGIAFEGTPVPAVVAAAARPFVGRPASRANLQALVAAMTQAYGRSEVALFTIVVPRQDLTTGTVRVRVGEGHIEAVLISGEVENRHLGLVRAYADRLTHERPTRRATLERYLSLIQDIPGLTVHANLAMGEGPGGVRLLLALDYRRPTLAVSFDNRTTRLIRDGEFQAVARGYGLIREGDSTELTGAASVDFHDQIYFGLSHSTPLGTEGTRLGVNGGYLATHAEGTGISGEARTLGLSLTHPLIRGYRRNLTLSLALDGIDSDNAAFGSLIASEHSRALRAAEVFTNAGAHRVVTAIASASRGLGLFGADVPREVGDETFTKVNGRVSFDQSIGRRAALRLRAAGQWTGDPLPAVERFSVGGADFGRAFETGLINADRGYATLGELAWRPLAAGRFGASEIYGFGDWSEARLLPRAGFAGQDFDLASAGAGVRFAWTNRAMIELEYARTVDRPFPGYPSDWRVSIGWRVSIRP
jgi:hemolysin activation/secretion protein